MDFKDIQALMSALEENRLVLFKLDGWVVLTHINLINPDGGEEMAAYIAGTPGHYVDLYNPGIERSDFLVAEPFFS